jgi:hypothetical protein
MSISHTNAKIPYRVFISYTHKKEDEDLVEEIGNTLRDEGMILLWDKNLSVGTGFNEQIKKFISHSHVFVPIITNSSHRRGWVHQEIGYAIANNIPILPLAIDKLPDAMMRDLQAILLSRDPEKIREKLKYKIFSNLIKRYEKPLYATYQCAQFTADRAELMANYARDVLLMQNHGMVRQKGGLSSFHIPSEVITNDIWTARYGKVKVSPHHCRIQREERLALEEHASVAGCKIIVDPSLIYEAYGPNARKKRLEWLKKFLISPTGEKAQVAFFPETEDAHISTTIVGDWFYAESHSGKQGRGYHQTIFTRHAPSIQHWIDLFDQEFQMLLDEKKWDIDNCREQAVKEIDDIIKNINSDDEIT